MDLFLGLRLSRTPTSPNWKLASTRATFLPISEAATTARLTATVVRPTPPLGEKTVTMRPGSRPVSLAVPAGRSARRVALSFSRSCTWRIDETSSSLLKGLTRNSRAPASIERRR